MNTPIGFECVFDADSCLHDFFRFLADSMQHGEMAVRIENTFLIGIKMDASGFCGMAQQFPRQRCGRVVDGVSALDDGRLAVAPTSQHEIVWLFCDRHHHRNGAIDGPFVRQADGFAFVRAFHLLIRHIDRRDMESRKFLNMNGIETVHWIHIAWCEAP